MEDVETKRIKRLNKRVNLLDQKINKILRHVGKEKKNLDEVVIDGLPLERWFRLGITLGVTPCQMEDALNESPRNPNRQTEMSPVTHDADSPATQTYVTTKIVQAHLAAKESSSGIEPGYRVIYPNGYISWCPKEEFERVSRLISDEERSSM